MAKRKKGTKHHTGRRRMGAVPGRFQNTLMEVAGLIAASVGGTVMQRQLTAVNPKVVSAGQLVAGYMIHDNKHPFLRGAGYGLLGTGAIGLTHELGMIHGLEDLVSGLYGGEDYISLPAGQSGIANQQYVAGIDNRQHLSGMEEEEDGIRSDYWRGVGL